MIEDEDFRTVVVEYSLIRSDTGTAEYGNLRVQFCNNKVLCVTLKVDKWNVRKQRFDRYKRLLYITRDKCPEFWK